jgi:hypothetical protein
MKFEVGDNVIVKLTNEEGKVLEILNEKLVLIDVKGVKFPAYTDQLDYPYFNMFYKPVAPKPKPVKQYIDDVKREKPKAIDKKESGIWLHLFPIISEDEFGDDIIEFFRVYLINDTANELQFQYDLLFQGENSFTLKNELLPFHDFYVHDVSFEDFSYNPSFNFIFNLKQQVKNKAPYIECNQKCKGKQIFQLYESMQQQGNASIRFLLLKQYPDAAPEADNKLDLSKLKTSGLKVVDAKKFKETLPPARSVVDIHIEKLVDNYKNLSNAEILNIQLNEFEKWYDIAVLQHAKSLIIVHGVGEGVLRNEIHEILKYKKEVASFVNQFHPNFGYGATEIKFY